MKAIPREIVDYATKLGYTGQHEAGKIDGIIYYQLYRKSNKVYGHSRKIGLPVLVRLKNGEIEEPNSGEILRMIKELSIV